MVMVKSIKIEAIIEIEDNTHIDDALLKRSLSNLGHIKSCNVNNNFDEKQDVKETADAS